jgi:hypothetical protein
VPNHKIADGINAARLLLQHCHFDELNCEQGLNALRSYQREWDDTKRVFRKTPLHNWASHAADSFRYLAMAYRNLKPKEPETDWQEEMLKKPTLDEMWEMLEFDQSHHGNGRNTARLQRRQNQKEIRRGNTHPATTTIDAGASPHDDGGDPSRLGPARTSFGNGCVTTHDRPVGPTGRQFFGNASRARCDGNGLEGRAWTRYSGKTKLWNS